MPDVVTHVVFGRDVRKCLQEDIRARLIDDPYEFALLGPDVWFAYQPWKHREGRGRRMHTTAPGAFLMALADRCCVSAAPAALFSYLAGFLCHYALDAETHPYIIHITEVRNKIPRGHMGFEHSLDRQEMERAGVWGEKHPVTEHYFPKLRLPAVMREDIDAVFEEVYGWRGCWKALNHSCPRYRLCYRVLENPTGWFTRLTRITGHPVLKSLAYATSPFHGTDVENSSHTEWAHSHEPADKSAADFNEMKAAARRNALEMISAAYRYIFLSEISEEELSRRIGSRSYLSGLPTEDPRNTAVPFLLPPRTDERKRNR